jgi:phage/plasmid-associated DNA primase
LAYKPQFKLWMSTNHKPEVDGGDEAIWDRLRLIPFGQRFEGKRADTKLPAKLREELPGVLAWAVRGCVDWAEHGLGESRTVTQATEYYRTEMNVIRQFVDEMCIVREDAKVSKTELYNAWKKWAMETGEDELSMNMFARRLKEEGGVEYLRDGKIGGSTRAWVGITLENDPNFVLQAESVPPEKPLQNATSEGGCRLDLGHFSENLTKPPSETPRVGGFVKKDEKVSHGQKSVPPHSTPPSHEFEVDGCPGRYISDEEDVCWR